MLVIKPFTDTYLEDAAGLFVSNYSLLRTQYPVLPQKYEDRAVIIPFIKNLADETEGVVAFSGGALVGYMLGMRLPYFKGTSYGAYCPEWAHSAVGDMKTKIYHQMYRKISHHWVANGCFTHSFTFLAHEREAIDNFFQIGFGLFVMDALRSLAPIDQDLPASIRIRPAEPGDAAGA